VSLKTESNYHMSVWTEVAYFWQEF